MGFKVGAMLWNCIVIGVCIFLLFIGFIRREGFSYAVNPCGAFKGCYTCANAAGCGWCSDLNLCIPMAQDGFPERAVRGVEYTYGEEKYGAYRQDPLCAPFGFIIQPERCPRPQKACMTRDGRGCGSR
jgi:hypothetical protein